MKVGQGDYIYFYSNTWVIYDHTSSTTQGLRLTSGAGDNIEVKNNIFINEEEGSTGCSVAILDSSWGGELDGNLYYKPAGDRPIRFGEVSDRYTAAELNAAYPQFEVNGIDGNPNIVDYGSAATCGYANLHLTLSSNLAIDGGIDLNSTGFNDDFDRISRPQGSAWDIGAYEYIESGPDTTPPIRSNGSPTGELSSGATSATLSLTTNENATCKYSTTPNTAYASMPNTFSATGTTSHSTTVSGLENGGSYTCYVRYEDAASNANPDDYPITFSVAQPLVLHGAPADRSIRLTWTVSGTLPITSTWQIDYQSQTGTAYLPITNVINSTRAYTLTGLTNYAWYTVTLNAMLESTPFLTDTVTVMPTDIFVYLPLIMRAYGP